MSRADDLIGRLQAEIERLDRESQNLSNQLGACGRELAALKDQQPSGVVLPEPFEMEPYQTVDHGSTNYKAGFNAAVRQLREGIHSSISRAGVMDERSAFEGHRASGGLAEEFLERYETSGNYKYQEVQVSWESWQARARLNPCRAQAVPNGYALVLKEPVAEFGHDCIFNRRKQANGERWPVGTKLYVAAPSANHCEHRFMHFGDQANRRCADCCAVEQSANHAEQNLDMVPDGWVCGNCGSNVQTRLDDGAQQKESGS